MEEKMGNKTWVLVIVIIFICLLITGVTGYYCYKAGHAAGYVEGKAQSTIDSVGNMVDKFKNIIDDEDFNNNISDAVDSFTNNLKDALKDEEVSSEVNDALDSIKDALKEAMEDEETSQKIGEIMDSFNDALNN